MKLFAEKYSILETSTDLLVLPWVKGEKESYVWREIDDLFEGRLSKLIKKESYEGKEGEALLIPTFGKMKAWKILLLGLGEKKNMTPDTLAKFGGFICKRAKEAKAKRVVLAYDLLPNLEGLSTREAAERISEGLLLAEYQFHAYHKKARERAQKSRIEEVAFACDSATTVQTVTRAIEEAEAFAQATHLARDLVNTPSADMTPLKMAEIAKEVASVPGISCKIFDAERMKRMNMRAALAVAQGSEHPPVGVHLVYKPKTAKRKTKKIAIVGKAVTFDSGGLSLKPSNSMTTMKIDMGGAATVLGLFRLLPYLKPNVEVHGIFLAVENMPSGSAYRPGDVVTAMNGTTIEILNTDAEGRVTLADALTYAAKQKPDAIIDLATLTGACVVALGEEITALLSNDRALADKLMAASKKAGEEIWELPLFAGYREDIKSKIADIKNVGSRGAGTITAALFLENFVEKIPWVHLDIAGTVYAEKESRPDTPYGGTGACVRTLARYLQAL